MVKVAVNGFGRIGTAFFRIWADSKDANFEIVHINGTTIERAISDIKYDSVYGRFDGDVVATEEGIKVNGKDIKVSNIRDLDKLPWKESNIDLVMESTGAYRTRERAMAHVNCGAKKVLISAPAKGDDITIVVGVNESDYDAKNHVLVSNASCTTNCLAPVAKALDEAFGLEGGMMTTIHAYTNDQVLVDGAHSDPRRARAAALNMIPTTTGAAKAVALVLPQLEGKFSGMSVRVPTPTVSMVDLVATTREKITVESVNEALRKASEKNPTVLGYSQEPLVSSDYRQDSRSSIVDSLSTDVLGDNMLKVISWYDNEWGYAARVFDLAKIMVEKGL